MFLPPPARRTVAPHHPCTGAPGATPHWMDSTDYLAGAQSTVGARARWDPEALPARQPSSLWLVSRRTTASRAVEAAFGNHQTVATAPTVLIIHPVIRSRRSASPAREPGIEPPHDDNRPMTVTAPFTTLSRPSLQVARRRLRRLRAQAKTQKPMNAKRRSTITYVTGLICQSTSLRKGTGDPALRSSRRSAGVPTARTVRRGVERPGASPPSVRRWTFTTGC